MTFQRRPTPTEALLAWTRVLPGIALLALLTFASLATAQRTADDLVASIAAHEQAGEYQAMLLRAMELQGQAESLEHQTIALRSLGRGHALLGDPERAIEFMNEAVELARADTSVEVLVELYRDTAGLMGELGRYDQVLALVDRGLASLERAPNPGLRGELLVMRGSALGVLGQLDEALSTLESVRDVPMNTERQRIMRENNLGMVRKWRGEYDLALDAFDRVLTAAEADGNEQLIVYALLELGDVQRRLGEHDLARDYLDQAILRAEAAEKPRWQLFAHRYRAELETAVGRNAAAQLENAAMADLQAQIENEAIANRARLLEVSLEVLAQEQRIDLMQVEQELQAVRLDRSRKLFWLAGAASALLLIALWLAVQQVRLRARANATLDRLANTDSLTGLHNRRAFTDRTRGSGLADRGMRGTVMLIDVDRFKQINDRFGHEHGDAVLIEVARRLQDIMRAEDIVCRWGGEEFLAFLPECPIDVGLQVAERIRAGIASPPIEFGDEAHAVTVTVGVAAADPDAPLEQSVRRADAALYRGKDAGRDRVERAEPDEAKPAS